MMPNLPDATMLLRTSLLTILCSGLSITNPPPNTSAVPVNKPLLLQWDWSAQTNDPETFDVAIKYDTRNGSGAEGEYVSQTAIPAETQNNVTIDWLSIGFHSGTWCVIGLLNLTDHTAWTNTSMFQLVDSNRSGKFPTYPTSVLELLSVSPIATTSSFDCPDTATTLCSWSYSSQSAARTSFAIPSNAPLPGTPLLSLISSQVANYTTCSFSAIFPPLASSSASAVSSWLSARSSSSLSHAMATSGPSSSEAVSTTSSTKVSSTKSSSFPTQRSSAAASVASSSAANGSNVEFVTWICASMLGVNGLLAFILGLHI